MICSVQKLVYFKLSFVRHKYNLVANPPAVYSVYSYSSTLAFLQLWHLRYSLRLCTGTIALVQDAVGSLDVSAVAVISVVPQKPPAYSGPPNRPRRELRKNKSSRIHPEITMS